MRYEMNRQTDDDEAAQGVIKIKILLVLIYICTAYPLISSSSTECSTLG